MDRTESGDDLITNMIKTGLAVQSVGQVSSTSLELKLSLILKLNQILFVPKKIFIISR